MAEQKKKKLWDNYKEIAEVQKSASIKLVVAAAVRDNVKYINIREFYLRKRDNQWMPGRDGISIPVSLTVDNGDTLLAPTERLIDALHAALNTAAHMSNFDANNAVYYTPKEK